ncbi:hypothetical protein K4039_15345 [Lyngbya sp. CCAP 1446/10]|nr:hypothetical protein [Lyngbya sp. CCAP 1446/10]MCW6051425.1 hypothetical protein [Lyngbya sp. CCAP 1446/10]
MQDAVKKVDTFKDTSRATCDRASFTEKSAQDRKPCDLSLGIPSGTGQ